MLEPMKIRVPLVRMALGLILIGIVSFAVTACLASATGCVHVPSGLPSPGGGGHGPGSPAGTEPIIIALNLVAWGGILLGVGALVAGAWLPIPKATAGLLILSAIGAWALKILLVKMWWLILLVAFLMLAGFAWHFLGGTMLHFKGKRGWLVWWIERRSGRDLNEDGSVGEPKEPVL